MAQYLVIQLGADNFELSFRVRSTPLADLWLERMSQRDKWPMDNPDRFYGFGTVQEEQDRAQQAMQQCIDTINNFQPIIAHQFEWSQDRLNYFHNIFEQYHGLLDQQNSLFWLSAPDTVRRALANLNLLVHRCEAVMQSPRPEFICTWFGMPKITHLSWDLQTKYGESQIKFGTVYLNYCEIGKTVEDLARDNDKYISQNAFKPFDHYSADFVVVFYDFDLTTIHQRIDNYITNQKQFFNQHHIHSVADIQATPQRFPVADLQCDISHQDIIAKIKTRQYIKKVSIQ